MSFINRLLGTPTASDLAAQLRSIAVQAEAVADAAKATKEEVSRQISNLSEIYGGASIEERQALEIRRRVLEIVGPENG